jgi:glutamine amidotransferase
MIAIIDYNSGNLGSIKNMLDKIGADNIITNDPKIIRNASKIILPGVGSFDNGIKNLRELQLIDVLNEVVFIRKTPILGICLGMQLMCIRSQEGLEAGLGWIPQEIKDFRNVRDFGGTIPVMGWNILNPVKKNFLLNEMNQRFYFVHGFYCEKNEFEILETAIEDFKYCAAFNKDNIYGVQFHPEKSHMFGLSLLKSFCKL